MAHPSDALIEVKRTLSGRSVDRLGVGENNLTEMPKDALMRLVVLDMNAVVKE